MKICARCGGGYEGRANKYCNGCKSRAAAEQTERWHREHPNPDRIKAKARRRYAKLRSDPARWEAYLAKQRKPPDAHKEYQRTAGLRHCTCCDAWLPTGWFERKGVRDGVQRFNSWCKTCLKGSVARRAARIRRATTRYVPRDIIKRLLVRQAWMCAICHTRFFKFHVDHIVPVSKGGEHAEANLQLTHPLCNLAKGAKLPPVGTLVGIAKRQGVSVVLSHVPANNRASSDGGTQLAAEGSGTPTSAQQSPAPATCQDSGGGASNPAQSEPLSG